jgi:hypothetical protein
MTIKDRIAQLERRVDLMSEYLKEADLLDFYSYDRALSIRLQITNQIQALKWVVEEEKKFKEAINEAVRGMWKIDYKTPTEEDYDGSKLDFMLDDELSHLPKSDDVEKRWWQVKTYLGLASDKDEVVDYKNTTGLED